MNQDTQKRNKKNKIKPIGPSDDCNCPVCVFTKSQAPGNPYDLKDCPKYNSTNFTIKNKEKKRL
ncbi:MAG: hypothetical protein A2Y03_01810 [Omnitrophica WOR_2 bacterium GWF2_38_59]|nr:MAG: hypothetical protein A2Y06_05520 [Omnitrophica WOR_2 bacterium GWA2_37_7]OGX22779.1 MAG: hypothetical protein A2Y03_01810 [Omnitrophica WOR_2 bacterium GWF2_38_59]OGX50915.1 MAG: hypothetical protein A2243_06490 [Omnitrophica WOR_2 bacterium RIFOXYA2_FULL_38_17]